MSNKGDKLNDITNENIQKKGQITTKSPKAEISAGKGMESFNDNIATSPEAEFLSVITTTNTSVISSVNHPEQFTAEHKMQFEELEVDTVDDGDDTGDNGLISFGTPSNRSNDEFMAQNDGSEKGIEQDSTLPMMNEGNDGEESESAIADVSATESTESMQSELEPKSISLQTQQQQDESESDDSAKEQNNNDNFEVDHKQDEMQSETNITEMEDLIDKESDEEMKQQASDDVLEALITKAMTEGMEEAIPTEEKSKVKIRKISETDRKKVINAKTPS
ncbi:unnamed protein product [Cercopithifilaria johnstoni]|uniref:Uncharacterized protein n=1 Tax=Cercopithifilaria johnstoni TaxID=2874296 RepID=A0A8J2LY59_9BILA|nr:unnamed protein product [Cercopithifilaria johnstoni]